MLLVVITFLLVAIGVIAYCVGAWKLSRYAARISGGLGVAVLLLPPVAFWFAFFKLEQEGKEMPTTLWMFGIVSTILLVIVFWTPISYVLTGRMDQLDAPSGVAETAVAEYGEKESGTTAEEPKDAPAPEPPAANTQTNGAAPAATNNQTNDAAAPAATNNQTNGAEAPAASP